MLIRRYQRSDSDAVVRLSLRAWAPVFASIKEVMDPDLYEVFYPEGWRSSQRDAIEAALSQQDAWVAEQEGTVIGFVSVVLHDAHRMGEIHMVAVDPDYQANGVGTALIEHATDWMRKSGMVVAMVETGGDPGHSPARHVYERTGFGLLPVARYFKRL